MSGPGGNDDAPAWGEAEPGEQRAPYQPYQPYQPYGPGGLPPPLQVRPAPPLDGVSIAAFVLSLVCCFVSPIALGLGIGGLARTKNGKRSGRWAAITGVVLGGLGTAFLVAAVGFAVWMETTTVSPGEAAVGDCVDVDSFGDDITLHEASCSSPHDAEIVYEDRLDTEQDERYGLLDAHEFCFLAAPEEVSNLVDRRGLRFGVAFGPFEDSDNPSVGDEFVCYAENGDGSPLEGRIGDERP